MLGATLTNTIKEDVYLYATLTNTFIQHGVQDVFL